LTPRFPPLTDLQFLTNVVQNDSWRTGKAKPMPMDWQQINGPCQLVECNPAWLGINGRCYLSGRCSPSPAASKLVEILGWDDNPSCLHPISKPTGPTSLSTRPEWHVGGWHMCNSTTRQGRLGSRCSVSQDRPSGLPRRIWKSNSRLGGAR
jgi:hypothetical protein